jgi:RNA recognition motif-containing protein
MDTYSSTPYQSSASRQPADKLATFLFVGGVPLEASREKIKAYFEKFGSVHTIDLPINKEGRRKGCAFVRFLNPSCCESVLSTSEHIICGKAVAVRNGLASTQAANETREMQLRKIFVSNLPQDMQEEQVQRLFSSFGGVTKMLIPKGGIKRRAFCYVIMDDLAIFNKIISIGTILYNGFQISVSPAVVVGQVRVNKTDNLVPHQGRQREIDTTTCSSDSKQKGNIDSLLQTHEKSPSKFKDSLGDVSQKREYLQIVIPTTHTEQNYRFNVVRKVMPIGSQTAPCSQNSGINSHKVAISINSNRAKAINPQPFRTLYCPF